MRWPLGGANDPRLEGALDSPSGLGRGDAAGRCMRWHGNWEPQLKTYLVY